MQGFSFTAALVFVFLLCIMPKSACRFACVHKVFDKMFVRQYRSSVWGEFLQVEASIVLEPPDQKTRVFLVLVVLF
jgi:hypothetical protein